MSHKKKARVLKIINEITNYCMYRGANNCKISLEQENNNGHRIEISCYPLDLSIKDMEGIKESLQIPRQQHVEEYSWELTGENECYEELNMVGMMIDSGDVVFNKNELTVILYREE